MNRQFQVSWASQPMGSLFMSPIVLKDFSYLSSCRWWYEWFVTAHIRLTMNSGVNCGVHLLSRVSPHKSFISVDTMITHTVNTGFYCYLKRRRRRIRINSQARCVGAHPLCRPLSQRGSLDPVKLAYEPHFQKANS